MDPTHLAKLSARGLLQRVDRSVSICTAPQLTAVKVVCKVLTWHLLLESLGSFGMGDGLVGGRLGLATLTWVGHFPTCGLCCCSG